MLDEPIAVKCELFKEYHSSTSSFERNLFTQEHEIASQKNSSHWGRPQWRFHNPSLRRFDTIAECDRRTDGRMDAWTMAKTREALHAWPPSVLILRSPRHSQKLLQFMRLHEYRMAKILRINSYSPVSPPQLYCTCINRIKHVNNIIH